LVARLIAILDDITERSKVATTPLPPLSLVFLSTWRGWDEDYPALTGIRTSCRDAEHEREEIEAARPQPGTIELYGLRDLPSLPHVSSIEWHGWGESKYLRPTWIGQIAEKLPSLLKLDLCLEDAYDWGCNWRRQYQSGMQYIPV
jgi:hypothetical protein